MSLEGEKINPTNSSPAESVEVWKDPSLPIATLELQSAQEAVEWGVIAAALAVKVAEGAASRLGEKMIDALFGSQNYVSLSQNALAAIANVVRQGISAEALAQCNIKLQAMQEQMQLYKNAPGSNRFRLETALTQVSNLIIDLKRFEVLGIGSFSIAATLHLGMLLEFAFRSADPGNLKSVKQLVASYTTHAQHMKVKINEESLLAKVKPCTCTTYDATLSPPTESASEDSVDGVDSTIERVGRSRTTCNYFDGKTTRGQFSSEFLRDPVGDCEKSYRETVSLLDQELKEQILSIDNIIAAWQKISSALKI